MVNIEIIYPFDLDKSFYINLTLPEGSTVEQALDLSKIFIEHPQAKLLPVGIFGKLVDQDLVLKDGDRIEIYRLLLISPKEKRRRLAKKQKKL